MNGMGGLIGLGFGAGLHLVVTAPPRWQASRFARRVNDWLHPHTVRREALLRRVVGEMRLHSIAERQRRAGQVPDASAHLLNLVTWSAAGLALGAAVVAAMTAAGALRQPIAATVLIGCCVASGWLLADRRLDTAARRRRRAAALELPSVAETLSLAVAAGAALPHAIELLVARQRGVLASELALVLRDLRDGGVLDRALASVCERLPVPAVTRFIDALRVAMERGTPIVEVLHAQASDARNESRRLLLEQAGKREVAMLLPVVFLILPAVVVIALFPGFTELGSMAQPL